MHLLCGLCREQAPQRLPELRRRFCSPPDPAGTGMAAWVIGGKAPAVEPARAIVLQSGGHRGAFGTDQGYSAGAALNCPRIARSPCDEAIHSFFAARWIASLTLAMTGKLPRRHDRALDFAKTDAIAVALAPAVHHKRVTILKKCS